MNKGIAPFVIAAEPFGPSDGKSFTYPLRVAGTVASKVNRVNAIYRYDWQGRQKLYPYPRTNIVYPSTPNVSWGFNNSPKLTKTEGVTDPAGGTNATRYVVSEPAGQGGGGPFYSRPGSNDAGHMYRAHVWLRGITGNECVRIFPEQSSMPNSWTTSPATPVTTAWKRYEVTYSKSTTGGALTLYIYGSPTGAVAQQGWGIDVYGLNIFVDGDENGGTINTVNGPQTVTDYALDGVNVTFGQLVSSSAVLLWDGEVLADVLVRESTDLARAIKGELFGPGDGVQRILPLKVGGSVYGGVSGVSDVYRKDWQGTHRLRTYERTNQCRNATALNKWTGYYQAPDGRQTGDIGPDGKASAFSFLLNPVGNGRYAGIYDGDDAFSPWDRALSSKVGVWMRCDSPATVYIGARQLGTGQVTCKVTDTWQFFSGTFDPSLYSPSTNRGFTVIYDSGRADNAGVPKTARLYIAFPQLTQDDVLGRFIPTGGALPGKIVDYAVIGPRVCLREAATPDASLSWDGEIFWPVIASLLPPNAQTAERSVEAATARIGDVAVPLRDLWSPWKCPAELLPWLAWTLSVDTWRPEWPEYVKRQRLASAISIQRHKGTGKSVRDVVESFGGAVEIVEWWQKTPKGMPHTFDLTLTLSGNDGQQATAQFVDDVIAEVNKTKPVRSQFNFTQGVSLFGSVGVAPYARAVVVARLELTGS